MRTPFSHCALNSVRNFSPAIAGLETERGIISNGVNLSAEFNATTGLTLQIADFISLSGFFSLFSLFG